MQMKQARYESENSPAGTRSVSLCRLLCSDCSNRVMNSETPSRRCSVASLPLFLPQKEAGTVNPQTIVPTSPFTCCLEAGTINPHVRYAPISFLLTLLCLVARV